VNEGLLIFALAVAVFAIVGVGVGMLVGPRLGRLVERGDEEDGDRTD
jgi:hypothetical protein